MIRPVSSRVIPSALIYNRMEPFVRFSPLVRQGLKFRKQFEAAKPAIAGPPSPWYPYDSFANLFYLQILM